MVGGVTVRDRQGPSEAQSRAEAQYRERQHQVGRRRHDETRAQQRAHDLSIVKAGKGSIPRTLDGLLHWYATVIEEEKPTAIHARAVWSARQSYDADGVPVVPPEHVGGSELGTRAYSDPMRRTLENSPDELDDDGFYVRPLASALKRMRWGSPDRPEAPLTVKVLDFLGQSPADWRNVGDLLHIAEEIVAIYLHRALEMLWPLYRDRPPVSR